MSKDNNQIDIRRFVGQLPLSSDWFNISSFINSGQSVSKIFALVVMCENLIANGRKIQSEDEIVDFLRQNPDVMKMQFSVRSSQFDSVYVYNVADVAAQFSRVEVLRYILRNQYNLVYWDAKSCDVAKNLFDRGCKKYLPGIVDYIVDNFSNRDPRDISRLKNTIFEILKDHIYMTNSVPNMPSGMNSLQKKTSAYRLLRDSGILHYKERDLKSDIDMIITGQKNIPNIFRDFGDWFDNELNNLRLSGLNNSPIFNQGTSVYSYLLERNPLVVDQNSAQRCLILGNVCDNNGLFTTDQAKVIGDFFSKMLFKKEFSLDNGIDRDTYVDVCARAKSYFKNDANISWLFQEFAGKKLIYWIFVSDHPELFAHIYGNCKEQLPANIDAAPNYHRMDDKNYRGEISIADVIEIMSIVRGVGYSEDKQFTKIYNGAHVALSKYYPTKYPNHEYNIGFSRKLLPFYNKELVNNLNHRSSITYEQKLDDVGRSSILNNLQYSSNATRSSSFDSAGIFGRSSVPIPIQQRGLPYNFRDNGINATISFSPNFRPVGNRGAAPYKVNEGLSSSYSEGNRLSLPNESKPRANSLEEDSFNLGASLPTTPEKIKKLDKSQENSGDLSNSPKGSKSSERKNHEFSNSPVKAVNLNDYKTCDQFLKRAFSSKLPDISKKYPYIYKFIPGKLYNTKDGGAVKEIIDFIVLMARFSINNVQENTQYWKDYIQSKDRLFNYHKSSLGYMMFGLMRFKLSGGFKEENREKNLDYNIVKSFLYLRFINLPLNILRNDDGRIDPEECGRLESESYRDSKEYIDKFLQLICYPKDVEYSTSLKKDSEYEKKYLKIYYNVEVEQIDSEIEKINKSSSKKDASDKIIMGLMQQKEALFKKLLAISNSAVGNTEKKDDVDNLSSSHIKVCNDVYINYLSKMADRLSNYLKFKEDCYLKNFEKKLNALCDDKTNIQLSGNNSSSSSSSRGYYTERVLSEENNRNTNNSAEILNLFRSK